MASPLSILKKYYGYSSFRPGQEEIIAAALSGRDSLVLMPTGGGKSVCYQVPALLMEGCALVVSPLIALMNDQVLALQANGIPAEALHSNRDERLNTDILERAAAGKLKILYVSPERLVADIDFIAQNIRVSEVAIDEAHCISQWGHDFRPVYTSLSCVKEKFPGVPVMALTATADKLTRTDISGALGLEDPFCWTGSFDRPNISLRVISDPGKKQRLKIIASLIYKYSMDSGIVYCLSRRKTEEMHEALSEMGFRSVCYHAGLHPAEREEAQRAFVNGDAQVVCATIAFGMGIDKSNIRWVVHNNIPGNIESYYQEIGRAGRDGMPSEAIMFYNYADVLMRRNFVEASGQAEINGEKLDFMQKYAEASVCRRRILLSYFSEEATCDCGNCDNCRSPRPLFDGTVLAQKVLSAVIRAGCREGANNIIDILRGANRRDLFSKGYHQLKTYGAGRDLSSREWHSYILQMVQLGLFEVAYEDNFHLRPTPYGMRVVRGQDRIALSEYREQTYGYGAKKRKAVSEPTPVLSPDEQLMENLKKLRKKISDEQNIAAYMVFSDATLAAMVKERPADVEAMSRISGVGEMKLARFGRDFIGEIRKFQGLSRSMPAGTSQKETLILFNSGMSPESIAGIKNIQVGTVYGHLAQWADNGKAIDFRRLLSEKQLRLVERVYAEDSENAARRLQDEFSVPGHIIRIAQAQLRSRAKK